MTLIFHKSDNDHYLNENNNEPIHLFMQYFIPDNKQRKNELKQCMYYNAKNKHITKIHLLNEKLYTKEELGVHKCGKDDYMKIVQKNIEKRLSFKILLDYIKKEKIKGYIVISNTDIFFDQTVNNIRKTSLHKTKGVYCQVRYEFKDREVRKNKLFGCGRADSQDVWILHSNFLPEKINVFNFRFGVPGCDNKLVYLFLILGYKVYNDPMFIRCYHNHKSEKRNYEGMVHLPFCYLVPKMPSNNHISNLCKYTHRLRQLKNIEEDVKYFDNMVYKDNQIFKNYLDKKIKNNENFVVPRIAGVENNVVHLTYKLNKEMENILYDMMKGNIDVLNEKQRNKVDHDVHFSGIKNYLDTMKNNAGIMIGGTYSLTKYCFDYLKAFENCDMYLGWAKWGNVYQYIIDSHNFIEGKFKRKEMRSALVLDIFHYIHNPWTHCLKGKRILIISPFIDSMKEKEAIRKNIYGIDLFPDCSFVYLKPPQTQADIESKDYYMELEPFFNKVSMMKDDFDIALCSCGGYGNIVVNYIYELGKSAIYVGGVLQMYFGIYGSRWMRERKDVMQLYLNNNWSRPKNQEKPKGFEKVEGSAYW